MLKRGKRANIDPTHHVMLTLFELILVVLVLISLLGYVKSIEKNTLIQKSYLSKDLALLASTIYASPGNVNYVYMHPKIDLTQFRFSLDKSEVRVVEASDQIIGNPIYYPFAANDKIIFAGAQLANPYAILFRLAGDELRVSSSSIEESLVCPSLETRDQDSKSRKIVIDPGHGEDTREGSPTFGDDSGDSNTGLREQVITLRIANSLRTFLQRSNFNQVMLTRDGDYYVSQEDRMSAAENALFISIHTGNDPTEEVDSVTAYINSASSNALKSQKLACLILKEFSKKFPEVKHVEIVKLEPVEVPVDQRILEEDSLGVLLEISNLQLANGILGKPSPELAEPIYNAMLKYYE
jgi:N-acetylmuramoyl-L-alanine amidase